MEVGDLSIEALIRAVSDQILDLQTRRIAAGKTAVFEVSDLTLEVSFVVTESAHGGGGFDIKVIKADGGVQYDRESIQKVVLKLSAVKDDQPFGGFGTARPRTEGK